MDRHKYQTNRHKSIEKFKSGSLKRKIAEEEDKKNKNCIANSRLITDFKEFQQNSSTAGKHDLPASPSQPEQCEAPNEVN